jgi:hypothetical protein
VDAFDTGVVRLFRTREVAFGSCKSGRFPVLSRTRQLFAAVDRTTRAAEADLFIVAATTGRQALVDSSTTMIRFLSQR